MKYALLACAVLALVPTLALVALVVICGYAEAKMDAAGREED